MLGTPRDKSLALQQQALEKLRALPGVSVAGAVDWLPLAGTNNYNNFRLEGQSASKDENAGTVIVTPGYLEAMNIQLVRGRAFDGRDVREASGAVLVNVAFAEKYYGQANPIGKRLLIGIDGGGKTPYYRTIVGVVDNVLHSGLDEEQRTEMYVPFNQLFWNLGSMAFVLRTRGEPNALLNAAQGAIAAVDRNQAIFDARTMERVLRENSSVVVARLIAGALAIFGALALLLAALGLYGVISYGVAQRTYEIGVRSALGATRGDLVRLILGQGMGLVGIGLTIGLLGAIALTRVMSSMLHGVSAQDPMTFVQAGLILIAVAVLATVLPARRASRIDPAMALRSE